MANENDPAGGNDAEALKRTTSERDKARTELADATRALDDYRKRDAARTVLKGKVEDPDAVADLITPHLRDVPADQVAAHVASEQFAPRLAAFKTASSGPTPPVEGETPPGEGGEPQPATESSGFGAGPSPGQANGVTPLPGEQKIVVGSKEWNELVGSNDRDAIEAAYKAGRVVEAVRGF